MKTLLIPTDFSANARHAAEYGYNLAKQIKANIVLCNAVIVPAEIPQAGMVVWPEEEYDTLMDESADELKKLKKHLEQDPDGFQPSVTCTSETGILTDLVDDIIVEKNIDLVITGTHGSSGLSSFLLGNHSRNMIEAATKPLLLIPSTAQIKPVKKIAFATDFKQPEDDLKSIYALIPLAKLLNCEILLTHIYDEKQQSPGFGKWIKQFLTELSNKADYPQIYYRLVKNNHADAGLDWLCEHGQIDVLAMVHRKSNFLSTLLKSSHTQKIARHIPIPLLVFPAKRQ
jgi:nucleotide-binding universal stress UspA family protein